MAISLEFQERFTDLVDEIEEKSKTKRAKIIGIGSTTYIHAYNYAILPRVKSLICIADYFNVSVDYLVGRVDDDTFTKARDSKTFWERLTELRTEAGVKTLYELATKTHIHRNNMAQWSKCNYYPLLTDLELLADFFGVSIDYLLGRTDIK